ncbi:MAG: hypothetical protein MJ010_04545 [Paludibacteraceae bacterium]|nr:hypothetical protein [Paludibacteraceae bacterium]
MKKILLFMSFVAAAVMMTVCVSCKKDKNEPSKSFDFSNMSLELVESLYGQDSATVVSALIEQGFVLDTKSYFGENKYNYINKSYGLDYGFDFVNNKVEFLTAHKLYPTQNDKKTYIIYHKQLKEKHFPYFISELMDKDYENRECTENAEFFLENISNKSNSYGTYANDNIYCQIGYGETSDPNMKIYYEISYGKSDPDNPFNEYNFAKYGCGYSPRRK